MKILILTNFDPSNIMHGYGLLAARSINLLARTPSCGVSLGVLCGGDLSSRKEHIESLARPARYETLDLWPRKRALNETFRTYRSFLGNFLFEDEKLILSEIARRSVHLDAILWYSHRCDPISRWLPRTCKCPVVFYAIDSFTRFETIRGDRLFLKKITVPLVRKYERSILTSGYRSIIFAAEHDAEVAREIISRQKGVPIHAVPNGLDTVFFYSKDYSEYKLPATPELLYAGLMKSCHNVDAAITLVRKVIPKVRKKVKTRIAGCSPSERIKSLIKSDGSVEVTGSVPDMAQEYRNADLFVAPMYSGTGFINKIAEALSCGLPVVTTSQGASFLNGKCEAVRIVDDHEKMAAVIDELLENPGEIARLGRKAASYAREHFSWERWAEKILGIIRETVNT